MEKSTWTLTEKAQARAAFGVAYERGMAQVAEGGRAVLELRPERRSDAQNRRLWSMLTDISRQVDWHGQKLTNEEWKDVFSAALKRAKVVPGLDGGFVVCGQSTSRMNKAEMTEMQDLMEAFGVNHGVQFKVLEGEQ